MKEIKISIGSNLYDVKVAKTDDEKEQGLQNIKSLPESEGMLFLFRDEDEVSMWMENTFIPLDIIFIDSDLKVISVRKGVPESKEFMTETNVSFVLELNENSGVNSGDELEINPDKKGNKMLVLNKDGNTQMELDGGERIFSRANTKILIKFAKKAKLTDLDRDYKAVGRRVFKFLKTQDSNEAEYVDNVNE